MDIFEILTKQTGCAFISDLRFEPYLSSAREYVREYDLGNYPLAVLKDLSAYLYGEYHLVSREAIVDMLRGNTGKSLVYA